VVYLMWSLAVAAALPLLACLLMRRNTERAAWLIAAAFAVSLAMDLALYAFRSPAQGNAWVGYLGYPLQFGLFVVAVAKDAPARWIGLMAVLFMAVGSSAVVTAMTLAGKGIVPQELFLRILGGIGIAGLVHENAFLRRYAGPIVLYVVGCLPFVLAMVAIPRIEPVWLWVWGGYQAVRLAALLWMASTVLEGHLSIVPGLSHARQVHRVPEGGSA
jgi:hypothetical protein